MVQDQLLKDISYLQLWQPSCSVEGNHLSNLVEGIMMNNSFEIILNFDQWFQE